MLVNTPPEVTSGLSQRISHARSEEGRQSKSCLDTPTIAAQQLKSDSDLGMFYGDAHNAEWVLAVVVAAKAVVAATAIIAGTVLAANGPLPSMPRQLDGLDLGGQDLEDCSVYSLLNMRKALIA